MIKGMIKGKCKRCKKWKKEIFGPDGYWHDGLCDDCANIAFANDEEPEDWE